MATFTFSFFLFLSLGLFLVSAHTSSPYLSPSTLSQNYQKMLASFRIFIYTPLQPINFSTSSASIFYNFLVKSPFLTQDPNQAHLFLVPFSPDTSTRSLARLVRELRTKYPYWNRTLGADHFFISPTGIEFSSDRNVLELKKNSVQISVFPTTSGNFIPHKDITLPPVNPSSLALSHAPVNEALSFLCYLKWDGKTESNLVNELRLDPEFVIESEPSDHHVGRVKSSKFCLFFYEADVAWMTEAMAAGCVPVVIVDRPVQDFPLTDVLRWSEMALLVGNRRGVEGLKAVLLGVPEERYKRMREFSVAATHHMVWNAEPQPYDAFQMVMYQLWMRRHTIRYARMEDLGELRTN